MQEEIGPSGEVEFVHTWVGALETHRTGLCCCDGTSQAVNVQHLELARADHVLCWSQETADPEPLQPLPLRREHVEHWWADGRAHPVQERSYNP